MVVLRPRIPKDLISKAASAPVSLSKRRQATAKKIRKAVLFFGEVWEVYPKDPDVTNCCILGSVDTVCLGNNGCGACRPDLQHPAEGFYIGEEQHGTYAVDIYVMEIRHSILKRLYILLQELRLSHRDSFKQRFASTLHIRIRGTPETIFLIWGFSKPFCSRNLITNSAFLRKSVAQTLTTRDCLHLVSFVEVERASVFENSSESTKKSATDER
ncbi:hypothetical protein Cgig2_018698 [Carnegiea gigantea]|uniref:Uncharacterized protein n=1 Tax=Carnegiea gigantea TaxID=171969 RepID=A0A9Q1KDZ8_9CARY|nr:hypothetical protein Cgig2_018698 [Carnegiea gigantea]